MNNLIRLFLTIFSTNTSLEMKRRMGKITILLMTNNERIVLHFFTWNENKIVNLIKELMYTYVLIELVGSCLGVVAFCREALGKPVRVSAVIVNHVVGLSPFELVLTC